MNLREIHIVGKCNNRNVAVRRRFNRTVLNQILQGGTQCRFRRRKRGVYYKSGGRITGKEIARCRKLAIPPAYAEVCVHRPSADLQATAVDVNGKRHYYYSKNFLKRQMKQRMGRVKRLRISKLLAATRSCKTPEQVALRMLAKTYMRPGSRSAIAIGAFGLKGKHMKIKSGGYIELSFVGKSGVRQKKRFRDAPLTRALKGTARGNFLLTASRAETRNLLRRVGKNGDLKLKDIRSAGANKVFKTCRGSAKECHAVSAAALGHTPAVNKKYYVM